MAVLLIAEHNNKELRPFTLNAASAASQIDNDVHAVLIGNNSGEAAVIAFKVNGLTSLLLCSAINNTDIILPLLHFLVFELVQQR